MTRDQDIAERFQNDVSAHQLTLLKDDGAYRHLRLAEPNNPYHFDFDLLTWPYHLCITGETGHYVFHCRQGTDLFEKVRNTTKIHPEHWAERLISIDRVVGFQEFDGVGFWDSVLSEFQGWAVEATATTSFDEGNKTAVLNDLRNDIRPVCLDPLPSEDIILQAAENFFSHGFELQDLPPVYRHTTSFLWCCHAIAWTIAKYDQTIEQDKAKRGQLAEKTTNYLPDLNTFR